MELRRVYLVRHGERLDFVDREWYKTAKAPHDPPLTERGLRQAEETGRFLQARGPVSQVLASPFLRTVQTADRIAEALDLPLCLEHGASEWLNGQWFGNERPVLRSWEELKGQFPRLTQWTSLCDPGYPETGADVTKRCRVTAEEVKARLTGVTVIVGHGASVEMITRGFCGDETKVNHVTYCSVTEVLEQEDGSWILGELHMSSAHLSEPEDRYQTHYI